MLIPSNLTVYHWAALNASEPALIPPPRDLRQMPPLQTRLLRAPKHPHRRRLVQVLVPPLQTATLRRECVARQHKSNARGSFESRRPNETKREPRLPAGERAEPRDAEPKVWKYPTSPLPCLSVPSASPNPVSVLTQMVLLNRFRTPGRSLGFSTRHRHEPAGVNTTPDGRASGAESGGKKHAEHGTSYDSKRQRRRWWWWWWWRQRQRWRVVIDGVFATQNRRARADGATQPSRPQPAHA